MGNDRAVTRRSVLIGGGLTAAGLAGVAPPAPYAESNNQHVFAAHLAWDEGFGEGWTEDDLWGMTEQEARTTLFGTVQAEVQRYAGRIAVWNVANEVTD